MSHLPLIVGFGGINPAGRGSFHHAYRRLIIDQLDQKTREETLLGLATLTGLASFSDGLYYNKSKTPCSRDALLADIAEQVLASTLIRRIESEAFDVHQVTFNKAALLEGSDEGLSFVLRKRHLPEQIPSNWNSPRLTLRKCAYRSPGSWMSFSLTIKPRKYKRLANCHPAFARASFISHATTRVTYR